MIDGWILLYRDLLEKPIWKQSTAEQKVVLVAILLMVNHKPKEWFWKGERFMCQPGQRVTSLESIKDKCGEGISVQNIRTALVRFEKMGFLTNESTKSGRLITVRNWKDYQQSIQQRPNKDLTPNNNDNNEKNFNIFWETWPKKVAKETAFKAFKSLSPDEAMLGMMLVAVKKQLSSEQWSRDKQFIPNPATWIRGKRWEDEVGDTKPNLEDLKAQKQFIDVGGANAR